MTFDSAARKPDGWIYMCDVDGNVSELDTKMCCHCGTHFIVRKGSGTKRGFCMCCMKLTCGNPACDACTPLEKRLDDFEKGKIITL